MRKCLRIISFLMLAWLGGLMIFVSHIPQHERSTNDLKDAVIVLTGGSGRVESGVDILNKRKARTMFISGVEQGLSLDEILKHNNRDKPIEYTNFEATITLGDKARSTIGNALEIKLWLADKSYKTAYLVTANYHMPRSLLILERSIDTINFTPAPVFPEKFQHKGWYLDRNSLRLILLEYHKYIITYLTYGS